MLVGATARQLTDELADQAHFCALLPHATLDHLHLPRWGAREGRAGKQEETAWGLRWTDGGSAPCPASQHLAAQSPGPEPWRRTGPLLGLWVEAICSFSR